MTTLNTEISVEKRKLNRELSSDELELVLGGALQAYGYSKGGKTSGGNGDTIGAFCAAVYQLLTDTPAPWGTCPK